MAVHAIAAAKESSLRVFLQRENLNAKDAKEEDAENAKGILLCVLCDALCVLCV